ncbi:DUF2590 family protein [Enterovibrio nigricans]|uniref:Phage protein n=1 Tax=Enterovibrio nigricans DSM 22720 TaxID=1121868 RepID=A0A1T4UF00_9GAMM|nr:DUF2590 family protein [Enterovibrio nigricans]PKF51106.1 DUF2590 domain-containing protein [Enterovibrio nigricans]SKA51170.1 Protein of unknown function [Enterovibrio nigricans DSM 22720]
MSRDYIYQDMLIENGDVKLDDGRNPVLIKDAQVIAQDIKHAIIESGLAVALVGENSPSGRADIKKQIELLVEEETRLVPGTVTLEEPKLGQIWIFADTREFGALKLEVSNG